MVNQENKYHCYLHIRKKLFYICIFGILDRRTNCLFYLIEANEFGTAYILPSYYFATENISACFMNIDRKYWIFLICKPVKTSKLSALAQKLSKPQNPRQFHLLVVKKNKSIKLKRERIIL